MEDPTARGTVRRDVADSPFGALSSQLQEIVDEASRVLGRPLTLTDRHLRLLAHTEHEEDELDRVRLQSIMRKPPPAELFEWLDRHGAYACEGSVRVPANPELGYDGRVVAPIRFLGHHLGWLSCTDRDHTATQADLERLATFADEAAVVLYRELLLQDLSRSRERELLRDILSPDVSIRRDAAWQLAELECFTSGGRVVVLVAPLAERDDERSVEDVRAAVESVLLRVRRHLAPKHGLHLQRPAHALILASAADPGIRTEGVGAFAERFRDELVAALGSDERGHRQIVAVGGMVRDLTHALTSYDQALRAADAAAAVSTFGDVVCWDDLGIYQLLSRLPIDGLGADLLHPGVRALIDSPKADDLLPTLERYLDLGGDVQHTAASLYLYRTTLYRRLRRIEHIAQVDLRNGEDRLALHLSLKIARLQGMTWPAVPRAARSNSADHTER